MQHYNTSRKLGDKLGPKLIPLIANAVAATKLKLLDTEHRARVHSMQTIIDRAGHEIADLYGPLVQPLIDHDATPEHVKDVLRQAASGRDQWKAISGFALGASGIPSAISTILNNFLAPAIYQAVQESPNLNPDVQSAASFVATGNTTFNEGSQIASGWGFSEGDFLSWVQLAQNIPGADQLFNLANRGLIDDPLLDYWLTRSGYPQELRGMIAQLRTVPLSPADLADMVVRGIMDQGQAEAEAFKSGVQSGDFGKLVLDTGEPPSLTDLLEAERRGYIDNARLEHGIRQSRIRNEWIDVIKALTRSPMSTADAITALVQGHIDETSARTVADQNGLMPQYFQVLWDTAGEPISKTEVIQLLRRKVITRDTAVQALRESRLKNKYIDAVLEEIRQLPPARETVTMLAHGALTHAQVTQILSEEGYDAEIIAALIKTGQSQRVAVHKQLSVSLLGSLYEDGAITHTELTDQLKSLGYTDHDAGWIAEYHDLKSEHAQRVNAINRIRALYLGHKISETDASARLDALGVNTDQRDKLLANWDIEIGSNVRMLSSAQIADAWQLGLIGGADAVTRLVHVGYDRADAIIILQIKGKVQGTADSTIPGS